MPTAELTLLNSMASQDFDESLQIHKEWGLKWMDLRDGIYGHWVKDLPKNLAKKANANILKKNLGVYCLSTSVFFADIHKGEEFFRAEHLARIDDIIELAKIIKPEVIRLIAAQLPRESMNARTMDVIEKDHSWLIDVYRESVYKITEAGMKVTIENEAFSCFLSRVDDFQRFFEVLDREGKVGLTWDVQNHWATGVFPTMDVYEELRPLIQYYHVKGGREDGTPDRKLKWNSSLEDSDWPVNEITQAVVNDGVSPVICLNPSQHGEQNPDYDYTNVVKRDIDYLRKNIQGVV